MKIIWAENPLATVVEVDDRDIKILELSARVDLLEDRLYGAYNVLKDKRDVDAALSRLNLPVSENDDRITRKVKDWTESYVTALTKEPHDGDCTMVPCSCYKCQAESHLGIDTIEGLTQRETASIKHAFYHTDGSINAAIEHLQQHNKSACGWLTAYRDAHFPHLTETKHD